ncbi:uncharacterized protein LOC129724944 isoform X2 [Wyeomyia smithii]|uniref:uncharacterized protein LOC129724944 isoform X2 n=1 Tax=Wyeomyia smithii TaxID=174621 RepID=UPI0024680E9E|nr:uncharacterized protein LOC129724944 isoform X2 [Wyeomyia smithii]
MAYVVWRVLVKQYSKVRLGVQRNPPLDDDLTPNTRRAKSFDESVWKSRDSSPNLSSNLSAVSSVALSSRYSAAADPSPSACTSTGNTVSCGGGLDDILVIESESEQHSGLHSYPYSHCGTLSRGEVRKSRSKMKSYLKRCKDALIGSQATEDTCPITHHEAVVQHQIQQPETALEQAIPVPTANWYLDDQLCEIRPEDNREPYSTFATARLKEQLESEEQSQRQQLSKLQVGHESSVVVASEYAGDSQGDDLLDSVNESGAAGGLVAQGSKIPPSSPPVANSSLSSNGIEKLIDQHFGPLYPDYADHTRSVLIRQARDLLVCTFHGDLERFEADFLAPAADIVSGLQIAYLQGTALLMSDNLCWHSGWPLAVAGALVLHLGALDESLVRSQDLYLCIRPEPETNEPRLYAVWRGGTAASDKLSHQPAAPVQSNSVVYRQLDPVKDPVTPLAVEMLAEDLPALLQNLLVGIERAICRVPLEELSFPPAENGASSVAEETDDCQNNNTGTLVKEPSDRQDKYIFNPGTPKIGIKRRELITKNKLVNNKYALKRITNLSPSSTGNNNNNPSATANGSGNSGNQAGSNGNNPVACHESFVKKSENTQRINGNLDNESLVEVEGFAAIGGSGIKLCDPGGAATVFPDSCDGGGSSDNHQSTTSTSASINSMPLFCLGGSFPHIDSDEESGDDMKKCETAPAHPQDIVAPRSIQDLPEKLLTSGISIPAPAHPQDIVAPRSIQDLPEKLLTSGISIPGTYDRSGSPLIYIEVEKVLASGLNCYEIATVLLYYNTLPIQSPSQYCIHLLLSESSQLTFLETLDSALQLLSGHLKFGSIYVSGSYDPADNKHPPKELIRHLNVHIKYLNNETVKNFIGTDNLPIRCCGFYVHDQNEWIDFFRTLEPLQVQCITTGRRLVNVLNDIRLLETQGTLPTRRQLHSQHRALSRALMDSELQSLRRKGPNTIQRLQDKLTVINNKQTLNQTKNLVKMCSLDNNNRFVGSSLNGNHHHHHLHLQQQSIANGSNSCGEKDLINARLSEVITIYQEVDRAARKLEQLTEQRRERLREMTRQRALDDEINEVISWIRNDGRKALLSFNDASTLENVDRVRDLSQEFEKFYFISKKHLAKGKDLHDASADLEIRKDTLQLLKDDIDQHQEQLERTRERLEETTRLHKLIESQSFDDVAQVELLKLAEKIDVPRLLEQCKKLVLASSNNGDTNTTSTSDNISLDLSLSDDTITATSTPEKGKFGQQTIPVSRCISALIGSNETRCKTDHGHIHQHEEDEEEQSKMADSGLGGCDRCEGNEKLERTCSCQSLNDPKNGCTNSDDLDEDCFEGMSKPSLDLQIPLQANAHLYCHASNLQLDYEENNVFDQKTQKTLLLIMREMIGTERDYVRSLQYVIENYMQELLREDIPQALRGQRNVIFGNIERICEFHQQHFLNELENCEHHPMKVGSAFLRHESKFYLYALYNKNKPKSDSLMSENGTQFFKTKQMELNDKMDLASYLLKPVQRMGKYALLLQQLMKACAPAQNTANQEILEDLEQLQKAEEMVRFQLRHGNDLLAMDSLRDCDVNVKEQGRLLRQNEFLVWEGKAGKKSLRQVFLFEELVLFSKARRFPDRKNLDIYIYKNSIKTSDIGLTAHVGDSPYKFEIWFRKRKPGDTWTLQTMSEDIKNTWTEEISKLLWKQAKRNREIRLAEMSSMGIGSKPCLDIRPSQDQINDRSISITMFGKTPKLRNSFIGALPESKSVKRPQSIISVSSSSSSGSSVVSTETGSTASGCDGTTTIGSGIGSSSAVSSGCSASSSSGNSTTASITTCKRLTLNITDPNAPAPLKMNFKKHQRSTTLVSQCSMESGIIADISLSPDEALENPLWPQQNRHALLRKSHSVASTSQEYNKAQEENTKPIERQNSNTTASTTAQNNSSTTNASDTITVHL